MIHNDDPEVKREIVDTSDAEEQAEMAHWKTASDGSSFPSSPTSRNMVFKPWSHASTVPIVRDVNELNMIFLPSSQSSSNKHELLYDDGKTDEKNEQVHSLTRASNIYMTPPRGRFSSHYLSYHPLNDANAGESTRRFYSHDFFYAGQDSLDWEPELPGFEDSQAFGGIDHAIVLDYGSPLRDQLPSSDISGPISLSSPPNLGNGDVLPSEVPLEVPPDSFLDLHEPKKVQLSILRSSSRTPSLEMATTNSENRSLSAPLTPSLTAQHGLPSPPPPTSPLPTNPTLPASSESPSYGGRYRLRQRTNLQKNPYTNERIRYKRFLQHNPEAILKYKSPPKHAKHSEKYIEDISLEMDIEDTPYIPPAESQQGASLEVGMASSNFDVALGDNEEDKELQALFRRIKRRSDERQEHRLSDRRRNLKSRPFPNLNTPLASSSRITLEDTENWPQNRRQSRRSESVGLDGSSKVIRLSSHPIELLPQIETGYVTEATLSYSSEPERRLFSPSLPLDAPGFPEDGDFSAINLESSDTDPARVISLPGRTVDANPSSSDEMQQPLIHDTSETVSEEGVDQDNRHTREESEPEEIRLSKKERKRLKALKKMFPRNMIPKLLEEQPRKTTLSKSKRRRATSQSSSDTNGRRQAGPNPIIVDSETESEPRTSPPVIRRFIDLDEESEEDLYERDIRNWLYASEPSKFRGNQRTSRGGDLINRMLTRTTRIYGSEKPSRRVRKAHPRYDNEEGANTELDRSPRTVKQTKSSRPPGEQAISTRHTAKSKHRKNRRRALRQEADLSLIEGSSLAPLNHQSSESRNNDVGSGSDHNDLESDHSATSHKEELLYFPSAEGSPRKQTKITDWTLHHEYLGLDDDETLRSSSAGGTSIVKSLKVDCGIRPFRPGICFSLDTYIGLGRLHELASLTTEAPEIPDLWACSGPSFLLTQSMLPREVIGVLPPVMDCLLLWATANDVEGHTLLDSPNNNVTRFLGVYISKLPLGYPDDSLSLLDALAEHTSNLNSSLELHLATHIQAGQTLKREFYLLLWYLVELRTRVAITRHRLQADTCTAASLALIRTSLRYLIQALLHYEFDELVKAMIGIPDKLYSLAMPETALQLWVCSIHLLQRVTPILFGDDLAMTFLWQAVQDDISNRHDYIDLNKSERVWRAIFSLCAFSQFSIHGMTHECPTLKPTWNTVNYALAFVKLTADESQDQGKTSAALSKRDQYIRLVTSRCFLLCSEWRWSLHEGERVLYTLSEVFRSRNFANLLNEASDFPLFIRELNINHLHVWQRADMSYTSFLKSVVKFKNDSNCVYGENTSAVKLSKLLSTVVPVNALNFSCQHPPVGQEISRLYNRFTAAFVAIVLQPSSSNASFRMQQCRRYVTFDKADWDSRRACIRALMSFIILHRHFSLDLSQLYEWSSEMSKALLLELRPDSNLASVLLCLQMLLGGVRKALETPTMDPAAHICTVYPDVKYLDSAIDCITKIPRQIQASDYRTADEVRKLVQSFLDARKKALPQVEPSSGPSRTDSQDEYGTFDLDMDDPELIAALGGDATLADNSRLLDKTTGKLMDEIIAPYMYARVCKQVEAGLDDLDQDEDPLSYDHQWIDCWVECASVAVANSLKSWNDYSSLGSQSWTRIADPSRRRQVGMRFLYGVLKVDSRAYRELQDRFLDMFFQCLAAPTAIMEHEYMSLFLAIDGLRHPLLKDVGGANGKLDQVTTTNYKDARCSMFQDICRSIRYLSSVPVPSKLDRLALVQASVFVHTFLSTICDHLEIPAHRVGDYSTFVRQVVNTISQLATFANDSPILSMLSKIQAILK